MRRDAAIARGYNYGYKQKHPLQIRLRCPKPERKEGEEEGRDLVFPNGVGTVQSADNLVKRGFYPALRRAGLRKIRFHDLRHTFASLMFHNREPVTNVSKTMGHASPAITLSIYAHMIPTEDDGSARRLDQLISFGGRNSAQVGSKVVAVEPQCTGTDA